MSQITTLESVTASQQEFETAAPTHGATDGDASDADARAFLELLHAGQIPSAEELQQKFDENFQTMSYLFMKSVYSHAEDEIKKRQ